jgi:hypothetical protein
MRSIPYSDIEKGVAAIAGIDPSALLAHEKILLAEYINDATKLCWDYYPWAEFTKTEERYFRDDFVPNASYEAGDEVHYEGKYYRARLANQSSTIDISEVIWYEVGDVIGVEEWSETGLYYKGAKVSYFDKSYICINQPVSSIPDHGLDPCSFGLNRISVTDTSYFQEIDSVFDRYIAYEQTGKDVIGTCLAITLEDPRYSDTSPLNWREDREGFYIEPRGESFNKVWIRYRLQAPTFTSDSTTDEVPRFLSQAIKAYAYKHWLIGDGQHEKAQLQDMYGLDLLVRELDKLDSQQDRGQQFTIIKNPYRRINAKQGFVTPVTDDKIGKLYDSTTEVSTTIEVSVQGRNVVVKGDTATEVILTTEVTGKNALKVRESTISIEIQLGKTVGMNFAVDAYPDVIGTRVKTGVPIAGKTKVIAYNAVKYAAFKSSTGRIIISGVFIGGKEIVKTGFCKSPPPRIVVECVDVIGEKDSAKTSITVSPMIVQVAVSGINAVKKIPASASIEFSAIGFGRSSVVLSQANSSIVTNVSALGSNAVKKGSGSVVIAVSSVASGSNVVKKANASGLIHLVITTSTEGIDAVHLGFVNAGISINASSSASIANFEGITTAPISLNISPVIHQREKSALVESELSIFAGAPPDIQLFDPLYINTSDSWTAPIANASGTGINDDDIFIGVGSSYYAKVLEFYSDDTFTPVKVEDLPNYNFGSYGSGYTFEYLMASPDVVSQTRINDTLNYKIQDDTVLIRKLPLNLVKWRSQPTDPTTEAYLIGFPHTFNDNGTLATGDDVYLSQTKTAPAGARSQTKQPDHQLDYSVSLRWAVIAPHYTNSNSPYEGTLRSTSGGYFWQYILGSGKEIVTATDYHFMYYATKHNNYEAWDEPPSSSNWYRNLPNVLWSRTNPTDGYAYRYINDQSVNNSLYPSGVVLFEGLKDSTGEQLIIDASGHTCEYGGYEYPMPTDNDVLYHDQYDAADPWDLTTAWDVNNYTRADRGLPASNINNQGFLFRIIPEKLKQRFPVQFQDFTSDEQYRGAPKYVKAIKN